MRGLFCTGVLLLGMSLSAGYAQTGFNPVIYTTAGASYNQHFDGLPATGSFSLTGKGPLALSAAPINASNLTGWQLWMMDGSNTNASFATGTGSSTGNGVYSLGNSGTAERALGSLSSGTGIYAFGLILTNQTGSLLNSFTIGFTAEQWRKGGSTNPNTWTFHYKTGNISDLNEDSLREESHLNFGSVNTSSSGSSLNGNLPANQQNISFTVSGISWRDGEQLLLRWDDADETGSDDIMAMDDFAFSASLQSSKPQISDVSADAVTATAAVLSATIHDNDALTTLRILYDTLPDLSTALTIYPNPDTLKAGTGISTSSTKLTGLYSGKSYYYRFIASNIKGSDSSTIQSFTTTISLPTLTTMLPSGVSTETAELGGNITAEGGAPVTERGIVWKLGGIPALADNRVSLGTGMGSFTGAITGLPQGATIYVRAYAINSGGVAYGNNEIFQTKNTVLALDRTGTASTNAGSVIFRLQVAAPVTGISAASFAVTANNITGASITSVLGSSTVFTITVATGNGDGRLSIAFANDNAVSTPFINTPFAATDFYEVDKTAPTIKEVLLPAISRKIGDTIPVSIRTMADTALLTLSAGDLAGMSLTDFTRINDSLYTTNCLVTAHTNDIEAADSIPVTISVSDPAGNTSVSRLPVRQNGCRIDRTRPSITYMKYPGKGIYKAGDTLVFLARFSEKVWVSGGVPSLTLTIGTRSRMALYTSGAGTDSLSFVYIIQSGEKDADGIKTASLLTPGSALLTDTAGNITINGFSNNLPPNSLLVDAVLPTVTAVTIEPTTTYTTGQHLDLTIQFSKNCRVLSTANKPVLPIAIGNKIRTAEYLQGSGSQLLIFRYTIQADDRDTDGIKPLSPLINNGQSIRDSIGNPIDTVLHNIASMSRIRINPPTIILTEIKLPAERVYAAGDSLLFVVNYSENVFIAGTETLPYLNLTIGKTNRRAYYCMGTGTTALSFLYQVQAGEEDTDGISVAGAISLSGTMIADEKGYPAPVSFAPILNKGKIQIDGIAPFIKTIKVPANKLYGREDSLSFTVTFSKPVFVAEKDTVFLALRIGSQQKKLAHQRNQNLFQLVFSYRIQPGDLDKNGVSMGTSLSAADISLQDSIGNKATLTYAAGLAAGIRIDAVSPEFFNTTDSLLICENSPSVSLAEWLTINDEESGETVYGAIQAGSKTDFISLTKFTTTSTGKKILFPGISYKPLTAATGIDTLTATVSDGINTSQKTIYIQITPSIRNNQIIAPAVVCADKTTPPIQGSTPTGGNGQYLFYWQTASSSDSTNFNQAAGNFQTVHYQPANLTATSWFRRMVQSGGCVDSSRTAKIIALKNGLWLGTDNSNWNQSGNWCGSLIPTATTDVFVYPATLHQPQINDTASCRQLTMAENTSLLIDGILQVYGKLEANARQLQAEKGTMVFSGQSMQQVSGKNFRQSTINHLIVNNPNGLLVTDTLLITGTLKLNAGKLHTRNLVWLKENACIGPSAAATGIEGNIIATELIKGGRRGFRLLAHPFSHPIGLHMIKDSIDITGEGGSLRGFTPTQTNAASAFYFDHHNANDSTGAEAGWLPFTDTNGKHENAWNPMEGIRLLVRGKPGQGLDGTPAGDGSNGTYLPLPVSLQYEGEIKMGDREKILPAGSAETYHSIGNPYLAHIDLSRVSRTAGISRHYWLWNPLQGNEGGYTSYPFIVKNIVPAFGAFLITTHADGTQQLLFSENSKSADPAPDTVPSIRTDEWYYVELRLETDTIFWDRLLLVQMDSARWGIDRNDAAKLLNNEVNFYSLLQNGKMLSIDARPYNNTSTIALGIESKQPQTFRIRVSAISLPPGNTLMLHDKWLNQWMPLTKDSSYAFSVTTDTTTQGNQRFEISSRKKITDSIGQEKIRLNMSPVPVSNQLQVSFAAAEKGNTSVRILSLAGKPLKAVSLGMVKEGKILIPVGELFRGIYLLELRCGNRVSSRKFIKD